MSIIWLRDFLRQAFLKGLKSVVSFAPPPTKQAHPRRIQPGKQADSNQMQDCIINTISEPFELRLLN